MMTENLLVKKESHRDVGGFTLDTDSGLLDPGPDCSFFTILLGQLTTPGKAGSKLQTSMHLQYLPPWHLAVTLQCIEAYPCLTASVLESYKKIATYSTTSAISSAKSDQGQQNTKCL